MAALRCCPLVPYTPTRKLGLAPCLRGPTFPILPRCSQESDLPTLLSSLHRGGRLVMPERQSRCDFQSSSVEIGLGGPGEEAGSTRGREGAAGPQQLSLRTALAAALPVSACGLDWQAAREASGGGGRRREVVRLAVPWGCM